jgi:hypothetical protein
LVEVEALDFVVAVDGDFVLLFFESVYCLYVGGGRWIGG